MNDIDILLNNIEQKGISHIDYVIFNDKVTIFWSNKKDDYITFYSKLEAEFYLKGFLAALELEKKLCLN